MHSLKSTLRRLAAIDGQVHRLEHGAIRPLTGEPIALDPALGRRRRARGRVHMPGEPSAGRHDENRDQAFATRPARGRSVKRLREPQHRAGRRCAGDQRVPPRVRSVLEGDEERPAVSLAGVGAGADVFVDHQAERRTELPRSDLEREGEAAGCVVRPVLRRPGRVVELPAEKVSVAVLGNHPCSEGPHCRLVDGRALGT